jgi:hypothetical protein
MKRAAKPTGRVVALDYNHSESQWEPDPPEEFASFYAAFLEWRATNGWDNDMADHLPELFRNAGLVEVECHIQDEIAERDGADFAERASLWPEVIEVLGEKLIKAGYQTEGQVQTARARSEKWVQTELQKQRLVLRAVTGRVA